MLCYRFRDSLDAQLCAQGSGGPHATVTRAEVGSLLPHVLRGETRRTYLVDDLVLRLALSCTMPAVAPLPQREMAELCRSLAMHRHGGHAFVAVVFYRARGHAGGGAHMVDFFARRCAHAKLERAPASRPVGDR
jgi:hypothetical protein